MISYNKNKRREILFDGESWNSIADYNFITIRKATEYIANNPLTFLDILNLCYYIDKINTTPKHKARLVNNSVELTRIGFCVYSIIDLLQHDDWYISNLK